MMDMILIYHFVLGQAGKGNTEEFGLLSLEYDENFCMGGPGVILSRETLRRGECLLLCVCVREHSFNEYLLLVKIELLDNG